MAGYRSEILDIEGSLGRYRQIVRGKIKDPNNLRKIVGGQDLIGRVGDKIVSIPIPQIELPHFRFGSGQGGVGQGEGEPGQPLGPGDPKNGEGGAGDQPGQHLLEVELTLDEFRDMFPIKKRKLLPVTGEEASAYWKMHGATRVKSIKRRLRDSYQQGLKVEAAVAGYQKRAIDPSKAMSYGLLPGISMYHNWEKFPLPKTDCQVINIADVSGSMTQQKKEMMRQTSFCINLLLNGIYRTLTELFIVHDAVAQQVDKETYYRVRESGGTKVSAGLQMALDIIRGNLDMAVHTNGRVGLKNWFIFVNTDGENFGSEDDSRCVQIMNELLEIPFVRLVGYTEYQPGYSSRNLWSAMSLGTQEVNRKYDDEKFGMAKINSFDEIYDGLLSLIGEEDGK